MYKIGYLTVTELPSLIDFSFSNFSLQYVHCLQTGFPSHFSSLLDLPIVKDFVSDRSNVLGWIPPTDHWGEIQPEASVIAFLQHEANDEALLSVNFAIYPNLTTLVISSFSFKFCRSCLIHDLPKLTSIVIRSRCFQTKGVPNQLFSISNCASLLSFRIGDYSFRGFDRFKLENLPALGSIDIGRRCFKRCSQLILSGFDTSN